MLSIAYDFLYHFLLLQESFSLTRERRSMVAFNNFPST